MSFILFVMVVIGAVLLFDARSRLGRLEKLQRELEAMLPPRTVVMPPEHVPAGPPRRSMAAASPPMPVVAEPVETLISRPAGPPEPESAPVPENPAPTELEE